MRLVDHHEKSFAQAVTTAILHVRKVMKREKHLNSRDERVGLFVTSLRRVLSEQNMSYMKNVCNTQYYLDAGQLKPSHSLSEKIADLIAKGHEMAGQKGDANHTVNDLNDLIDAENHITNTVKQLNNEADKVLEGLEQLVASL